MGLNLTNRKKKILLLFTIVSVVILTLNFLVEIEIPIKKELVIEKNIDEVWEIMGNQYAQVHVWSTNFKDSKPGGGSKFAGLDYSERITLTDRGETVQALDAFDPVSHSLSYHITKGLPSIAKKASATWSLISMDTANTKVVLEFNMTTKGIIGFIMANTIKEKIGVSAMELAAELKYYSEKGKPHPRKSASIKIKN
jgi:hypothetical protein